MVLPFLVGAIFPALGRAKVEEHIMTSYGPLTVETDKMSQWTEAYFDKSWPLGAILSIMLFTSFGVIFISSILKSLIQRMKRLINDPDVRLTSLRLAAIIFCIGSLFQFIASYIPTKDDWSPPDVTPELIWYALMTAFFSIGVISILRSMLKKPTTSGLPPTATDAEQNDATVTERNHNPSDATVANANPPNQTKTVRPRHQRLRACEYV